MEIDHTGQYDEHWTFDMENVGATTSFELEMSWFGGEMNCFESSGVCKSIVYMADILEERMCSSLSAIVDSSNTDLNPIDI